MLTYTSARNLYASLTNNNETGNLTFGDTMINEGMKFMLGNTAWPFLERNVTQPTVASQQYYTIPDNSDKLLSVTIQVGTYIYRPTQVTSRNDWDYINSSSVVTSDIPSYFYVLNGEVGFWPIPINAGNTIGINYQLRVKDISTADYTTGTILTATNGSTAIVGSGTSWTAGMVGKYLQITSSNTANKGDGLWYEIEEVLSATSITLVKPYVGTSISAGAAAYIIGDVMIIPEKYQKGSVYYAVGEYWMKQDEQARADRFIERYNNLMDQMKRVEGQKTTSVVIDDGGMMPYINPNLSRTATP